MDDDHDMHLAVLNALQTAISLYGPVTSNTLFATLPKCLRNNWTPKYLVKYVLRDLDQGFYIEATQRGPGQVVYGLTTKGREFIATG